MSGRPAPVSRNGPSQRLDLDRQATGRSSSVAAVISPSESTSSAATPVELEHTPVGRLDVADADTRRVGQAQLGRRGKRVPSSRCPALQTQSMATSSRVPHEWSR